MKNRESILFAISWALLFSSNSFGSCLTYNRTSMGTEYFAADSATVVNFCKSASATDISACETSVYCSPNLRNPYAPPYTQASCAVIAWNHINGSFHSMKYGEDLRQVQIWAYQDANAFCHQGQGSPCQEVAIYCHPTAQPTLVGNIFCETSNRGIQVKARGTDLKQTQLEVAELCRQANPTANGFSDPAVDQACLENIHCMTQNETRYLQPSVYCSTQTSQGRVFSSSSFDSGSLFEAVNAAYRPCFGSDPNSSVNTCKNQMRCTFDWVVGH